MKQTAYKLNNKGFTLVELIIVIVILAVLIGACISGVYSYVQRARINTDINNASAITSALAPIITLRNVTTDINLDGTTPKVSISEAGLTSVDATTLGLTIDASADVSIYNIINNMFPQGIDAPMTDGVSYNIYYISDDIGRIISVRCVAEDADGILVAQ